MIKRIRHSNFMPNIFLQTASIAPVITTTLTNSTTASATLLERVRKPIE